MDPADRVGFGDPPIPQVARAKRANLSRLDQAIKRLHRLLEGYIGIVAMGVVQVDSVPLQSPEALLALALDLGRAQASRTTRIVEPEL